MALDTVLFVRLAMAGWLLAGWCDWWCHRRTRIESTTGLAECLFHWLLLALGAVALALALWLQPSWWLMGLLLFLWLVHQATTWVELRYVVQRRNVLPIEQMVHSFLEIIPLALIVVIALDGWTSGQLREAGWSLRVRPWDDIVQQPLAYYAAATAVLVAVPFAEEAWRCWRHGLARTA